MKPQPRRSFSVLNLLLIVGLTAAGLSQHQRGVVHDTKAVIVHGPWLTAPTETSAIVVWMTDTPCHSKVVYGTRGRLDQETETYQNGLLPIGTRHTAHLTGLRPGETYDYKVVSTRVVRMKHYWPEKGLPVESPTYSFTAFDRRKPAVSFSIVTDTHDDARRLNGLLRMVNWETSDFLVHAGDAFGGIDTEEQLFNAWLDPIDRWLAHTKPLVFARGNHDLRGSFARELYGYVPVVEETYYCARDHGPVHLLVLDTGEDKRDDAEVYAGLNRMELYREEQLAWFRRHVQESKRMAEAPFRVLIMHQPTFGWVAGRNEAWVEAANQGKVDLVIAGHLHRFSHNLPGDKGNDYHLLTVGQDQLARVEVSAEELRVRVTGIDGTAVDSFTLVRR